MGISEKKQIKFYQRLGELFYAIAATDKVVRKDEFAALKKLGGSKDRRIYQGNKSGVRTRHAIP